MTEIVRIVVVLLEFAAASLLMLGFVIATVIWIRESLFDKSDNALLNYRRALGRVILIGLEVLVAATIIKTIVALPTLAGMGSIVALVVIRTAMGWTTRLETYGRWPWQRENRLK